jgi:hypothetical protein
MDLLGGFVGLVAFIAFLACLGKVCHTLSSLAKRERSLTNLFLSFFQAALKYSFPLQTGNSRNAESGIG